MAKKVVVCKRFDQEKYEEWKDLLGESAGKDGKKLMMLRFLAEQGNQEALEAVEALDKGEIDDVKDVDLNIESISVSRTQVEGMKLLFKGLMKLSGEKKEASLLEEMEEEQFSTCETLLECNWNEIRSIAKTFIRCYVTYETIKDLLKTL